jgi:aspartyl-tRNA(Asn)/glutamyl-tRNA(Gln) amidotransferase subunit A
LELFELTAAEARSLLTQKKVSSRELTEAALARIGAVDSKVKAFITVTDDLALAQADAVDAKIAAGETLSAVAGIPTGIKDVLCTRGIETTCASQILKGFRPPYSATVVGKLEALDSVFLGKLNMDEFAMGSSTENSSFFVTHNPWDLSKVPGGSSGGSTACVAASEAYWSLGTDTGGSIRQPAAFCGVVGIKPTYGRVSRYGLIAFASSLDQIGPVAKCVTDAATLLTAISGHDRSDSTSLKAPVPDYAQSCVADVKGMRLGVPREYFAEGVSDECASAVRAAADLLRSQGATVEECSLPSTEYALATYYIIAPAEASSNLARYDGVRFGHRSNRAMNPTDLFRKTREEGFGPEVKQRIMIGTYALSAGYYDAFYLKAQKVRTLIRNEFDEAFSRFDALLTPTTPTPAFGIGEKTDDPLAMKLCDILTLPINMAGVPAMSVPCGFSQSGLPLGMQIIGPALSEEKLIRVAFTYEQASEWHKARTKAI